MELKESFSQSICFKQDQVDLFGQISGDLNPVHYEDEAAKELGFRRKIVHGFLTGSIFSKIIAMDLPGNGAIYISQSMKFKKPIYTDIDYMAKVSILDLVPERKRIILQTQIIDLINNEVLLDGEAIVYFNPKV